MLRDKDECDIREKVIWFCSSCESANKITDLNCADCGTPLKKSDLVFNIETFGAVIPQNQSGEGQPYWADGGVSLRDVSDSFYQAWK